MPSIPTTPPAPRAQRADARRNREAILDAARQAFGTHGLDAQIDDIALAAGVGVGTVYRHFPTKDALIEALAEQHFLAVADAARATLAQIDAGTEPGEAFTAFVWATAHRFAADTGLSEIFANRPGALGEQTADTTGLTAAGAELMARVVAAGTVRADATVDDFPLLFCGLGNLLAESSRHLGMSWERYVTLMLDGLRAR